MVSPRGRRDQVRFLRERGLSQRRACGLLGVPRSIMGYRLRQPVKLIAEAGWTEGRFLDYFGIQAIAELPMADFDRAMKGLQQAKRRAA